jgi:hypothetical protein
MIEWQIVLKSGDWFVFSRNGYIYEIISGEMEWWVNLYE